MINLQRNVMRLHTLTTLCLLTLLGNTCSANKPSTAAPSLKRSLTLTPGYMERTFNSNDTMKYGPLTLMQLCSRGVDEVVAPFNDTWTKLGIFAAVAFPYYFLADTSHSVYHEFGHARAIASMGGTYTYRAGDNATLPTAYAYGIYIERFKEPSAFGGGAATAFKIERPTLMKIPLFVLRRVSSSSANISKKLNTWWKNPYAVDESKLNDIEHEVLSTFKNAHQSPLNSHYPLNKAYTSEAEVEKLKHPSTNSYLNPTKDYMLKLLLANEYSILVDVAGINNQMQYSQEVADLIFKNNGHQLYFFDYFMGKYEGYRYTSVYNHYLAINRVGTSDDIYRILRDYTDRGFDIKASDIQIGSLTSLFLSSTTWAFVYSACTELPKGSFLVHAPIWHGWRLPDLNFYMTTQGLSFQVVTGYQFNENWYAGLTAEMVYQGNTSYEFGPSIGYSFTTPSGKFDLAAQVIIGQDMELGGNGGIEWTSPYKNWTLGAKYTYHNALTLVGERNIPFLSSGFMSGGTPNTVNHEINMTVSYNY